MTDWLVCAVHRDIVVRALKTALVVGTVLVFINHGDALLAGSPDRQTLFRMLLNYFVPYAVSTVSSVGATRALSGDT
jgi:hypothetical protein